jgi:hypothetical protein
MWSFLLTYMLWGWAGLLLGLMLGGIGVVPLAMLATVYKAEWSIFGQLLALVMLAAALQPWGVYLISKAERNVSPGC